MTDVLSDKTETAERNDARRRTTLRDVAERAGVTPMTVSRALNRPDAVAEDTRARIDAAVVELGYLPNRLAGSLASSRSRLVPVVVPSLANSVFNDLVQGAQDALFSEGSCALLGNSDYRPEIEEQVVETLLGWSPDAVLIAGTAHTQRTRQLLCAARIPIVELMELSDEEGTSSEADETAPLGVQVGFSNLAAGRRVAEHLLARGYRRIAFAGTGQRRDVRAERRLEGLRAGVEAAGETLAGVCWSERNFGLAAGAEAVERLVLSPEAASAGRVGSGVEAIFFANDDMAVGGYRALLRAGLRVPGDLAVVGFNGLDVGQALEVPLTTVATPRYEIGRAGAQAALAIIAGQRAVDEGPIDLGFELIEGGTC